jgi:hypothetical protein
MENIVMCHCDKPDKNNEKNQNTDKKGSRITPAVDMIIGKRKHSQQDPSDHRNTKQETVSDITPGGYRFKLLRPLIIILIHPSAFLPFL